jgi:hypothetical protein
MIPLSGRVPGSASGPSRTRVNDGSGLEYFSWIDVWGPRVFLMNLIHTRKGDVRGRLRGPHQGLAWLGVGPCHPMVWPPPGPPPSVLWTLHGR